MTFSERFAWIFEARKTTANGLSEKAGLARSYLRNFLKAEAEGKAVRPGVNAIEVLARAADVSASWLSTGAGPREPYQGRLPAESPSPAPPPTSTTRTTLDAVDEQIDAAFDPTRHKPSDVLPVREAVRSSAALLRPGADPVAYVRRLLDVAARERERGRRPSGEELPALAVGLLSQQLDERDVQVQRMNEAIERARQWMLANGLPLPEEGQLAAPPPAKVEVLPVRSARKR